MPARIDHTAFPELGLCRDLTIAEAERLAATCDENAELREGYTRQTWRNDPDGAARNRAHARDLLAAIAASSN